MMLRLLREGNNCRRRLMKLTRVFKLHMKKLKKSIKRLTESIMPDRERNKRLKHRRKKLDLKPRRKSKMKLLQEQKLSLRILIPKLLITRNNETSQDKPKRRKTLQLLHLQAQRKNWQPLKTGSIIPNQIWLEQNKKLLMPRLSELKLRQLISSTPHLKQQPKTFHKNTKN